MDFALTKKEIKMLQEGENDLEKIMGMNTPLRTKAIEKIRALAGIKGDWTGWRTEEILQIKNICDNADLYSRRLEGG